MVRSQTVQPTSISLGVRVPSTQPDVAQTLRSTTAAGLLWELEQYTSLCVPLMGLECLRRLVGLRPAFRPQNTFRIGHGVISPFLN